VTGGAAAVTAAIHCGRCAARPANPSVTEFDERSGKGGCEKYFAGVDLVGGVDGAGRNLSVALRPSFPKTTAFDGPRGKDLLSFFSGEQARILMVLWI
jgi:hypothetical protein